MTRTNVFQYPTENEMYTYGDTPKLVGWFDADAATRYDEGTRWNGSNHVSLATGDQWSHQTLFATKSGRWILNSWSQWQGTSQTYQFVDTQYARDWMIRNEYGSSEIAQIFDEPMPAESGP